jgi:hypothetical protein
MHLPPWKVVATLRSATRRQNGKEAQAMRCAVLRGARGTTLRHPNDVPHAGLTTARCAWDRRRPRQEGVRVRRAASIAATAGLAAFVAGSAQAADVSRCVGIDDATARLACYDAVAGRSPSPAAAAPATTAATAASPAALAAPAVAAAAAAGTVATARAPSSATAQGAEQAFGLSAEQRVAKEENAAPEEMRARVSAVANHPRPGRWVVTLDNGQVWEQREAGDPSRRPRPGDEITIRKAALGSFLLVAPGRGTFRVARVK